MEFGQGLGAHHHPLPTAATGGGPNIGHANDGGIRRRAGRKPKHGADGREGENLVHLRMIRSAGKNGEPKSTAATVAKLKREAGWQGTRGTGF